MLVATALTMQVNAAPPTDPLSPAWSIVSSPNAGEPTELHAVAARTSNDVWAVGYHFNPTIPPPPTPQPSPTPSGTFIQHWDGTAWTSVPAYNPGNRNELYGVAVRTATDAWAVGRYNTTATSGPNWESLILQWNGATWSQVVRPGWSNSMLYGVTVLDASNAWAVGTWGYSPTQPLIFYWDGTDWSTVYAPTSYAYGGYLYGITARTATDVWAVGYENTNATTAIPLTLHWDGTSWQTVPSLNPVTGVRSLVRSVTSVAANNVWAVGQTTDSGNNGSPLTIHWDGTSWSTVTQTGGSIKLLFGVTALGTNDVWEVGANNTSGTPATLIVHWDGTSLSDQTSPNRPGENELYGVSAVASDDIWAVGRSNAGINQFQTLTLHYTTGTPEPTAPANTVSYYIQNDDPTAATSKGCEARTRGEHGVVVLDFGAPRSLPAEIEPYGTKLIHLNVTVPIDIIKDLVVSFAQGYLDPVGQCQAPSPGSDIPNLLIVAAVSNSARNDDPNIPNAPYRDNEDLTFAHGQAWARMISEINQVFTDNKLAPTVQIAGGYDAEYYGSPLGDCRRSSDGRRYRCSNPNDLATKGATEWTVNLKQGTTDTGTTPWAEGYDTPQAGVTRSDYYYFGSCEDCPRQGEPSQWTGDTATVLARVYHLSWQQYTAAALPQIYHHTIPYEWYNLRWYAHSVDTGNMVIRGATTGCGAAPSNPGCTPVPNNVRVEPRFNEACHPQLICLPQWTVYNCGASCPYLPPSVGWQAITDMITSPNTPEGSPNPNLPIPGTLPYFLTDIIYQP